MLDVHVIPLRKYRIERWNRILVCVFTIELVCHIEGLERVDRVDVVVDCTRRHLDVTAGTCRDVAVLADLDAVAVAPGLAVEAAGQCVVADVALGRADDRVRTFEVVSNDLSTDQVEGLVVRPEYYVEVLARNSEIGQVQLRRNRHFGLLDPAVGDHGRNGVRELRNRYVGRHVERHAPVANHAARVLGEQGIGAPTGTLGYVFHPARRRTIGGAAILRCVSGVGRNDELLAVPAIEGDQQLGHDRRIIGGEIDRQQVAGESNALDLYRVQFGITLTRRAGDVDVVAGVQLAKSAREAFDRIAMANVAIGVGRVEREFRFGNEPQVLERGGPFRLTILLRYRVAAAVHDQIAVGIPLLRPRIGADHRVAAQAGFGREVLVSQYRVELAVVAGRTVLHRLRIRELHRVRHVGVVHQRAFIGIDVSIIYAGRPVERLVDHVLPLCDEAVAPAVVAGLARREVGQAVYFGRPETVLQVRCAVALVAAAHVRCRYIRVRGTGLRIAESDRGVRDIIVKMHVRAVRQLGARAPLMLEQRCFGDVAVNLAADGRVEGQARSRDDVVAWCGLRDRG